MILTVNKLLLLKMFLQAFEMPPDKTYKGRVKWLLSRWEEALQGEKDRVGRLQEKERGGRKEMEARETGGGRKGRRAEKEGHGGGEQKFVEGPNAEEDTQEVREVEEGQQGQGEEEVVEVRRRKWQQVRDKYLLRFKRSCYTFDPCKCTVKHCKPYVLLNL